MGYYSPDEYTYECDKCGLTLEEDECIKIKDEVYCKHCRKKWRKMMKNKIKFILGLIIGAILIPLFTKTNGMIFGFVYGVVWTMYSSNKGWIE